MHAPTRYTVAGLVAALALPLVTHAQVYRCEADGQTVFAQSPCAPHAEKVPVRSAPASRSSSSGLRASERDRLQQFEAKREERIERYRAARANNRRAEGLEQNVRDRAVSAGMSAGQVRRAWGAPAEVISGVDEYGRWERWEYIRGPQGPRQYVRFRDGEVTSASRWPGFR